MWYASGTQRNLSSVGALGADKTVVKCVSEVIESPTPDDHQGCGGIVRVSEVTIRRLVREGLLDYPRRPVTEVNNKQIETATKTERVRVVRLPAEVRGIFVSMRSAIIEIQKGSSSRGRMVVECAICTFIVHGTKHGLRRAYRPCDSMTFGTWD